ncbi:hypothetical protein [Mucilaginibacter celer]|uniref:hypothetical protein n=1 Tax=Mucilaginibacter celer TaxID=2305508 RepID=UPI0013CED6CB|nr:hypothetical protein [Mucilaginibacter celer]
MLFVAASLNAQVKLNNDIKTIQKSKFKRTAADSLYLEINNFIYGTFYNPTYWETKTPTFTVLKVDITWDGRVSDMRFSDSADSAFVKAWNDKLQTHDIKATFGRYAKEKSYEYLSLLIPVSFEPLQPKSENHYANKYLESYLKFDKRDFEGEAIMMTPVFVQVLAKGNM